MQSTRNWRLPSIILWLTLPLYILDQVTKWWTVWHFPVVKYDGQFLMTTEPVVVIPDYFSLVRVHNTGIAWGLGNGTEWAPIVFLLVPVAALTVITVLWRRGAFKTPWMKIIGALFLAGVLGNLTDRLVQGFFLPGADKLSFLQNLANGYVVDFLNVKIPVIDYHWPVFNVADSCVCVAAVLLFLESFRKDGKPANKITPA